MPDISQQDKAAQALTPIFDGLKKPKNLTQYKLMQGVTDFGQVSQFNMYETGYSFLVVGSIPKFLEKLAELDKVTYAPLIENFKHILEYEFRGLTGIDDITADTLEITNGISNINLISKVNEQSASQVQMRYFEKSGSTLTKVLELFLKGIKDSKTQVKTYHGLIASGALEDGYENEIFTMMYFVTDNTARHVEKAYFLLAAQPTKAETSIYESEKGTIENKEITIEFNCFPVTGKPVYEKAQQILDWMNNPDNPDQFIANSNNFAYTGLDTINVGNRTESV